MIGDMTCKDKTRKLNYESMKLYFSLDFFSLYFTYFLFVKLRILLYGLT